MPDQTPTAPTGAAGQYRKKPVVIDAMQFDGENYNAIFAWMDRNEGEEGEPGAWEETRDCARCLIIATLEGDMCASVGDWIIRGVNGEYYPCKPDIFAATYEPADTPIATAEPARGLTTPPRAHGAGANRGG